MSPTRPLKRTSPGVPAIPAQQFLAWASLYTLAAVLGRQTVLPETGFAMIWPAAGVSILWFTTTLTRYWLPAIMALSMLTALVNGLTGAHGSELVTLASANLVQAVVGAAAINWLYRGPPGQLPALRGLADLWKLMGVAALASALSAVAAALGFWLAQSPDWSSSDFLAWTGRNGAGTLGIVAVGQLLTRAPRPGRDAVHHPRRALAATEVAHLVRHRWRELIALVVATIAMYWLVFGRYPDLPLEFPLLTVTAWAGLRFNCIITHVHSLLVGTATVSMTLQGVGPFAEINSGHTQATVSQLFLAVVMAFGLLLALGNEERRNFNRALKQARAEATERAHLLSTVLDEMHDGMAIIDEAGFVLMRNPAGRRLVGMEDHGEDDQGLIPSPDLEVLTADGEPIVADNLPFRRAFKTGEVVVQDVVFKPKDRDERHVQLAVTPLRTMSPDRKRIAVVLYHDANAEHEKRQALESFAGVVAHDLKAPLTVLRGWIEMLQDAAAANDQLTSAEVSEVTARLAGAASNMNDLISDLLLFSTARDSSIHTETVDLRSVVAGALQVAAAAQGAHPGSGTIAPLPAVDAEPALMRQLFANLLGNAFKYGREGYPVTVIVTGDRLDEEWVRIQVTDNGRGIPREAREKVFEAFHRLPGTGQPGSGLGLAICRRIVDRYGGAIAVEDNPVGPGANFTVILPAARTQAPHQ